MNVRDISTLPEDVLNTLLSSIPFYKSVRKESEEQFQVLMKFSRIVHFESGESVLSRGDIDTWTYFLVKGQLMVSVANQGGRSCRINYITPGEVFGDLSVLLKGPRTADVSVDGNCREAVLFGTDFGFFGEINDYSKASLATKLLYYRHTNHSLRWKLEMYRAKYHEHPMANKHREIKLYMSSKDDEQELRALYQQAVELAKLFVFWNQSFGNLSFTDGYVFGPDIDI